MCIVVLADKTSFMSYILAATDFSEVAENALHYACAYAREKDKPLRVLHSFFIPVSFGDQPMPVIPIDESRALAEERMYQLLDRLRTSFPEINLSGHVSFGEIVDTLKEVTEDERPDLVIIGNSAADDKMLWMGSNVVNAMRQLSLPVLAVPGDYPYQPVKNICFASDFKNVSSELSNTLIAMVRSTGARLHILHVDHNNKEYDEEHLSAHKDLHDQLNTLQPVFHYAYNEKADDGILRFVEDNHMDWLIIAPHKLSFFESLFHRSLTKAMVKICTIPVVALHSSSK